MFHLQRALLKINQAHLTQRRNVENAHIWKYLTEQRNQSLKATHVWDNVEVLHAHIINL